MALVASLFLAMSSCKILANPPPQVTLFGDAVRPWDELFDVALESSSKECVSLAAAVCF